MRWSWCPTHHDDDDDDGRRDLASDGSNRRASSTSKASTQQQDGETLAAQSAEAHLQKKNLLHRVLLLSRRPKPRRRRRIRHMLANESSDQLDDSFFCEGDDTQQATIKPQTLHHHHHHLPERQPILPPSKQHPVPPKTPKSPIKFRKVKSIKSLSAALSPTTTFNKHHNGPPKSQFESQQQASPHSDALEQTTTTTPRDEDDVQVDCLWECQRGLLLFGLPTFSANALLHFDPRQWVTYGSSGHSRNSAYDRESHPLPSAEWVWLDAAFLINMANDAAVDEQGWSYAFCFANRRHWLSQCRWFTFVRRRQWVRARTRVPDREAPEAMSEQQQQQQQQPKLPEPSAASSSSTKPPGPSRPASGGIQQPRPQSMRINSSKYKRLPLSDLDMEHLIAGESSLDVRDPFLRWADIKRHGLDAFPWMAADEGHIQLWKENVVDINYERAMRCLKVARVDRERTQLWKHWLGIDLLHTLPPSFQPEPDGPPLDSPSSAAAASSSSSATSAKSLEPDLEGLPRPDVQDVWDLAEARLDDLLLAYFFQSSREDFLSLLPEAHSKSHARHNFRGWDQAGRTIPEAIAAHPQIDWSDFQAAHILPRISFVHDQDRPSVSRVQHIRERRKMRRDASYATARDVSLEEKLDENDEDNDDLPSDCNDPSLNMVLSASPAVLTPAHSSSLGSYFPSSSSSISSAQEPQKAAKFPEPSASATRAFLSPTPQQPSILQKPTSHQDITRSSTSRPRTISFAESQPPPSRSAALPTNTKPAEVPLPPSPPASDEHHP